MYKNNYSSTNRTSQTTTSGLYGSNYYILTSEFKVYLCINNGSDPETQKERHLNLNQHTLQQFQQQITLQLVMDISGISLQ